MDPFSTFNLFIRHHIQLCTLFHIFQNLRLCTGLSPNAKSRCQRCGHRHHLILCLLISLDSKQQIIIVHITFQIAGLNFRPTIQTLYHVTAISLEHPSQGNRFCIRLRAYRYIILHICKHFIFPFIFNL